jgi:RNA polymerase I-specific transcription initiation factor RRN3
LDPFDAVLGQEDESEPDDSDPDEGDNFSDLSSDAGDMDDMEFSAEILTDFQHIRDMVKKLDAILKLVFNHLDRHQSGVPPDPSPFSASPTRSDSPFSPPDPVGVSFPELSFSVESRRRSLFHTLLSIFERTIICTFKSRYTQFLIFWYSSLDSEFCDVFQGMLVSRALLEQDQPAVTRIAAASYIASYVSRALFIDRDGARRVMGVLCNFLGNHLDVYNVQSQAGVLPSTAYHSIFYAVSQAVFLIFCFRWRDFLENGEEDVDELSGESGPRKKWMAELSVVQRLITSPLNPLKV